MGIHVPTRVKGITTAAGDAEAPIMNRSSDPNLVNGFLDRTG